MEEAESIADIVKVNDPKTGAVAYKVLVTLDDGRRFLSNECWPTQEAAYQQLRLHLRLLGVPEHHLKPQAVN